MKRFDATKYSERQLQAWVVWYATLCAFSVMILPAILFYLVRAEAGWTYLQAATVAGLLSLTIFPAAVAGWGIALRYSFLNTSSYFPAGKAFIFSADTRWHLRGFGLAQLGLLNAILGTFGIGLLMTSGRRGWGLLMAAIAVAGLVAVSLKMGSWFMSRAATKGNLPATSDYVPFGRSVCRAGLVSMALTCGHATIWLAAVIALLLEEATSLAVLLLLVGAVVGIAHYFWAGAALRRLRKEGEALPTVLIPPNV